MMAEQMDEYELVNSLKQLIINLNPIFKKSAGSLEQAEEQILHLEANDTNFHKYDIVKRVRGCIEAELGELMENEIEKHSINPNDNSSGIESLVQRITDRVLSSPEYSHMKAELRTKVNSACQYLLQNFEREFGDEEDDGEDGEYGQRGEGGRGGRPDGGAETTRSQRRRHDRQRRAAANADFFYSDGESSFGESSLNQSGYNMFLNNEQSLAIAAGLDKKKSVESRRDALKKLSGLVTVDDVLNCESWPQIRQGLQDALSDNDATIWTQSLKFIAKGFSSSNQSEMYKVLEEYIRMQFHMGKNAIPTIRHGLDTTTAENIKLLKAFRLLNEFQRQVPQYWVRYPEKFVDDVIESTLSLLSSQPSSSPQMNPVHYLAVIDPQACWFVKWMHGHYSRAPVLKALKRHKTIVDNAVRAVTQYITTVAGQAASTTAPSSLDSARTHYSGEELEFAYFLSSLHLLGNLICYKTGRAFFPVKLKEKDVTVTSLLVSLICLVTQDSYRYSGLGSGPMHVFNPCNLVLQVLKKVCSSETTCKTCMCNNKVTDTLLAPIKHLLEKSKGSRVDTGSNAPSERTLFQVADILALIASSNCGRKHLMYGEAQDFMAAKSSSSTSPAYTLALFSKLALSDQLAAPPSKAAIGNYVYVCRQLYNTCEGLQVMLQYDLHDAIAIAWREASREADNAATPTPSADGKEDRDTQYIVLWEDTLRDNLLNFTGTPRGVMLLEQTGAMNECVAYMYSRYERKLQVSKCEKFGYGYMMSHVAATAPGMVALRNTGFVKAQIGPLWSTLECVDESPLYSPKQWPVLPIDKAAKKSFINLINLLSSYCAVYEVLGQQPLPSKPEYAIREYPDSIPTLFDRIVMVDSEAKIHALFNYEHSHVFGLRLLSVLTSCLDTCLLLHAQYDFQTYLLKAQGDNKAEDGSTILLDMLSLERHYILVKMYVIGGPSERILPPRTLNDDSSFPFPLFSSYPADMKQYVQPTAKSAMKQESELSKFLSETKKGPLSPQWQDKCRRALCSVMTARPDQPIKGTVLQDLLERSVSASVKNPSEAVYPLSEGTATETQIKSIPVSSVQQKGIAMAVRYGQQLKLLSSGKEATENLTLLLMQCEHFLQQQQKLAPKKSPLLSLSRHHTGFDWFVATVFIMMGGNRDRAWKLLHKTSALLQSGYVWFRRLHMSSHLSAPVRQSGIPPMYSTTCHYVELILQTEIPHVYSAFKMSGYAPAQIVQHWLRQCFWNSLDWPEICHYICVCFVLGVDYQVYMCVAILKFLQTHILQQTQEKELIVYLKEEPIRGFKVGGHLEYMQQLESKYRKLVLSDMQQLASKGSSVNLASKGSSAQ